MAASPTPRPRSAGGDAGPVPLWDPVVRLTHWSIAVVVLLNAVLTRGGSPAHVWAGWIGLGLLLLRLIWGVAGTPEARFSSFPPAPLAALRHLAALVRGRPEDYRTHNPAGALMAYALWALLATVMATGLVMTGGRTPMQVSAEQAAVDAGDWSALVDKTTSGQDDDAEESALKDAAEEVHDVAANLILFLVLLHVGGVVLESRALRRNLVAAMIAGGPARKRPWPPPPGPAPQREPGRGDRPPRCRCSSRSRRSPRCSSWAT